MDRWKVMTRRLLRVGGVRVVKPSDMSYLNVPLSRGAVIIDGSVAKLQAGEFDQVHASAAQLWYKRQTVTQLFTGYALGRDGLWRKHSWVLDAKTQIVLEMAILRVTYYGAPLTPRAALEFFHHHVNGGLDHQLEENDPDDVEDEYEEWGDPPPGVVDDGEDENEYDWDEDELVEVED